MNRIKIHASKGDHQAVVDFRIFETVKIITGSQPLSTLQRKALWGSLRGEDFDLLQEAWNRKLFGEGGQ